MKEKLIAVAGGLTGACTLSLLHQALRFTIPAVAPRMDLLGMEAMRKIRKKVNMPIPPEDELYKQTFIGDIISNTLYYSLAGGDCTQLKGWALGAAAGWGAVNLPPHLNLPPEHSNRTEATRYLAFGLYFTGALTAAATIRWLRKLTK